ncbi:MAG: spore maturation protein [Lachnospiraceae bacterium]|nr:spore maturation protein [Lachnospiraceae bacterium]
MWLVVQISNMLIPALIFYIVATGLSRKTDIYAAFTKGAGEGLKTVVGIVPTLIGLMVAVGVLRASGFLDFFCKIVGNIIGGFASGFPNELISLFVVKLFSSSAATGLALDIYKEYGTDSFAGLATSLALASTDIMLILRGSEEYLQRQGLEFVLNFFHFAGRSGLAA